MQATSPIYFLDMPFAENGDKTIIPAEEASATGRATLSEGFPAITQTPIANGGIAPNRWDFNGMFFLLSQMAFWQQSGGIMTWQSTLGYTPPCMVYYGGKFWVALQQSGQETDAGAVTPVEGDYWTDAFNYIAGDKVFAETVTLTGDTTGSGTLDSSGNISVATTTTNADTADVATKLGSSTIGGIARGIYLSGGTATACSATVGSSTQPVYMKNGTITASSDTVGDSSTPVYLSNGVLTACDAESEIEADTSSQYLILGDIKIQWGTSYSSSGERTITLPLSYTSADSYVVITALKNTDIWKRSEAIEPIDGQSFYLRGGSGRTHFWLAIGY